MKHDIKNNTQSIRKKTILNAAMKLFSRTDFHEVTVDEIAHNADLSKGTLYLYFENKEALFFSIIKEKTDEFFSRLEKAISHEQPFEQTLHDFIKTYLHFFKENKAYFKIIHSEKLRTTMEDHQRMRDLGIKMFQNFINLTEKMIIAGKKENSIGNINADIAAIGLQGMLNYFVFHQIFNNENIAVEKETEQIKKLFLYGVSKKN